MYVVLDFDVRAENIVAGVAEPDGEVRPLGVIPNGLRSQSWGRLKQVNIRPHSTQVWRGIPSISPVRRIIQPA
jgi:hypothetical protein